jgi:fused signal recognition particle receptor
MVFHLDFKPNYDTINIHLMLITKRFSMFDFLKRNKTEEAQTSDTATEETKEGLFSRLKKGLAKTRAAFSEKIATLFLGKKELTPELFEEIETLLLTSDVGVLPTAHLMKTLTTKLARNELTDSEAAFHALKEEMRALLLPTAAPLTLSPAKKPFVILVVGVNGSGKTTTIGKLAHLYKAAGKSVMLAAGDTFRAAAIQQLQVWGERNDIPVIAQAPSADTAAVIYDALEAARARDIDVLIADTAGRLHTQTHLMNELQKVKRVLAKLDPEAPQEVLLVLDMTLGQNTINQVRVFNNAMKVTGLALTKLDGTAKGGVIFGIANEFKIPIRFIGIGEGIDDLRPFAANDFVDALFA